MYSQLKLNNIKQKLLQGIFAVDLVQFVVISPVVFVIVIVVAFCARLPSKKFHSFLFWMGDQRSIWRRRWR